MDIFTWFLAWTVFTQILLIYRGHLVHELLQYQLMIANFAHQFSFQAWYSYDQAFRTYMTNNRWAKWNCVNDQLFNLYLRGAQPRARCYTCGGGDHFTPACPLKRRSATSKNSHSANITSSLSSFSLPQVSNRASKPMPPFPDPQRVKAATSTAEFCHNFNYKTCTFRFCSRIHRCQRCNGPHPATQCSHSC